MHLIRFTFLMLIFVVAYTFGLPMRSKNKSQSTPISANKEFLDHHRGIENEKLTNANENREKYTAEKNNKSYFNPARYHNQIKAHKAGKVVAAHTKNLAQLKLAENTGYARLEKSKSGKKDHITAMVDWHTYSGMKPEGR